MRNALRLGKLFGIEIRLDYSWFIVFALVTWSLSAHYFAQYRWPVSTAWSVGVVTAVLFFGCVLAHELGHSLVAIRLGIPVRGITLFIFGGIAEITREPERPRDEFFITIAGLGVSAVLGAVLWLAAQAMPDPSQPIAALASWLGRINLLLAAFNLIPGFPLDGGRILRSIVWGITRSYRKATRVAIGGGQVVAYGFIFIGIWLFFAGAWVSGLWLAFIGWFLNNAAASTYQQVMLRETLSGVTARDVMLTDCPDVSPDLTLQQLVDDIILKSARRCFPVIQDGRVLGIVTLSDVTAVPQDRWPVVAVGQAMTPVAVLKQVPPDQPLTSVLELMTTEDINQVPVTEHGRLLGMVTRDRVLAYLATRAELGLLERREEGQPVGVPGATGHRSMRSP